MRKSFLLLFLLLVTAPANAACQENYQQAVDHIEAAKKAVEASRHPNPDDFADQFRLIVERLQEEQCLPQLMNLLQYIQAEKQKYPAPAGQEEAPPPQPVTE